MKVRFIKTSNTAAFMDALDKLEKRGAREACLMVVDGEPGLGKTATVRWWAVQNSAIFLRAKAQWTPAWFLRELLSELRRTPEHSFEKMYTQAIQSLGDRHETAQREGKPFALVIDEVDYISRRAEIMECIRDLSDMLEMTVILVGMGRVRHHLSRLPQIASRVGQSVEFKPCTLKDAEEMVLGLSEVPVKADLIAYLHEQTKGRSREIKEGIAAIERTGKRVKTEIGVAEMAGQTLFYSRKDTTAVVVRP